MLWRVMVLVQGSKERSRTWCSTLCPLSMDARQRHNRQRQGVATEAGGGPCQTASFSMISRDTNPHTPKPAAAAAATPHPVHQQKPPTERKDVGWWERFRCWWLFTSFSFLSSSVHFSFFKIQSSGEQQQL